MHQTQLCCSTGDCIDVPSSYLNLNILEFSTGCVLEGQPQRNNYWRLRAAEGIGLTGTKDQRLDLQLCQVWIEVIGTGAFGIVRLCRHKAYLCQPCLSGFTSDFRFLP